MNKLTDIGYFLIDRPDYPELSEPFIFGKYTVASSGFSLLRFASDPQYKKLKEDGKFRSFLKKVSKEIDDRKKDASILLKADIPSPDKCKSCERAIFCPECKNVITFSEKWGVCDRCGGVKMKSDPKCQIFIEGVKINYALLFPLKDIPVKVAASKCSKVLFFYSDDFSGLIMATA